MGGRVVEQKIQAGRAGTTVRLRVDLHGVSTFGPGKHHTLIRFEWITAITSSSHGVVVESDHYRVIFPAGAFGLEPAALADRLEQARSIFARADVLEELSISNG